MYLKEFIDLIEGHLKDKPFLGEKNVRFSFFEDDSEEYHIIMELVGAGIFFMNRSDVEMAIESGESSEPWKGISREDYPYSDGKYGLKEFAVITFNFIEDKNNSHEYTLNDALNSFRKITNDNPEKLGFDFLFYLDGGDIDYGYCFADFDMEILYDEDLDLVYFQATFPQGDFDE
jgi:hypothetical protein